MPYPDGRAWLPSWIIKLLAALCLTWGMVWASNVSKTQDITKDRLTTLETDKIYIKEKLDKIDTKLDLLLVKGAKVNGYNP